MIEVSSNKKKNDWGDNYDWLITFQPEARHIEWFAGHKYYACFDIDGRDYYTEDYATGETPEAARRNFAEAYCIKYKVAYPWLPD